MVEHINANSKRVIKPESYTDSFGNRCARFHAPPGFDWPLRAMLGEPLPLLAVVAALVGRAVMAGYPLLPQRT